MIDEYTDFDNWRSEGERLGLKGPYRLVGGPNLQLIGKEGTTGIWRTMASPPRGFIFKMDDSNGPSANDP